MKKIKRKIISCIGCRKEIEVLITSNRKYCSIKCFNKYGMTLDKRKKISNKLKGRVISENHKEILRNNMKINNPMKNLITRKKASDFRKNKTYEQLYGKEKAMELKEKRSKSMKREKDKLWRNNLSKSLKGKSYPNKKGNFNKMTEYSKNKSSNSHIEFYKENPEVGKNHSNFMKNLWKDENYKEKQIELILNGLMKRPTSFEQKISDLCFKYNLPFVYKGDGSFLINYKNPDFVNEKDKIVIEVFYSWFKIRDYGSVENYKKFCKNKYNSQGWEVIFFDEIDLNKENWENGCLRVINEMMVEKANARTQ